LNFSFSVPARHRFEIPISQPVVNPSTGKEIAQVAQACARDVDIAVDAATAAFNKTWGENTPGSARGKLLMDLAILIEEHADIIASIESQDNGKVSQIDLITILLRN
jgi:aldehyde dehydrogenase (NAD+)